MRTKSLFDYDHEGTKHNKNDIFNYTQVYLKKVQFLSKSFLYRRELQLIQRLLSQKHSMEIQREVGNL